MKHLTYIAALTLISLSACKKDYTCTCTNSTSTTTNSGTVYSTGESTEKFSRVRKKYAREHCTSTTDVETSGSGVNEVTVEKVHGCVLK